ncbi:MAG: hypothetical protein VKJ46_10350 [Leptolyngbyaceae bacterium]|nr:hypothetical protein [Leptolyngbyaceae bacterium]
MVQLNRSLFRILGLGWLSFGIAGLIISQFFAIPNLVILIDRSYCPSDRWQQVVQAYEDLYRQQTQKQVQIQKVILFSDLAEETLPVLPLPESLRSVATYGRPNPQRQNQLQTSYPQSRLLTCSF